MDYEKQEPCNEKGSSTILVQFSRKGLIQARHFLGKQYDRKIGFWQVPEVPGAEVRKKTLQNHAGKPLLALKLACLFIALTGQKQLHYPLSDSLCRKIP